MHPSPVGDKSLTVLEVFNQISAALTHATSKRLDESGSRAGQSPRPEIQDKSGHIVTLVEKNVPVLVGRKVIGNLWGTRDLLGHLEHRLGIGWGADSLDLDELSVKLDHGNELTVIAGARKAARCFAFCFPFCFPFPFPLAGSCPWSSYLNQLIGIFWVAEGKRSPGR